MKEKGLLLTPKRKSKKITERDMVNISNQLHGWVLYVYKFGCAFIHLSNFHAYSDLNPFENLSTEEQDDILQYLRQYHGGPQMDNPSFVELAGYFPRVFEKIKGNLEHYLEELESDKVEELW